MSSSPNDSPLHDSLHKCCLVLQLDSNEFCTTLRLPGRVYEAVETPDNPKAIIHHSKINYVEKVEDILGKEEFSLIENSHIGSILKVRKHEACQH
ncbi:BnaCnng15260D [Brassica napus]|uniref:BnaCnng15260D protein n=1 Tax=Brassica napus TaxID=3708 RepID=A0A078IB84_BRANA|nr:BnaCnng15260D [Brassica napus]